MKLDINRVYSFKLTNADEIVAKVVEDHDSYLVVSQPLSAVPTEKGIQLIFAIFTADPRQPITINKTAVAMICETRDELSDHYTEATTGIKPVRKPSIILG